MSKKAAKVPKTTKQNGNGSVAKAVVEKAVEESVVSTTDTEPAEFITLPVATVEKVLNLVADLPLRHGLNLWNEIRENMRPAENPDKA